MASHEGSMLVRALVMGALALSTIAMLGTSAALNFIYFSSYGQTELTRYIFGAVSVAADLVKGVMPIVIFELVRKKRIGMATICLVIWIPCFVAAMSSALGLVASERMAHVSGREVKSENFKDVQRELAEKETARSRLRMHRSSAELDAAIVSVMTRPIGRSTVGALSNMCQKIDARTSEACSEFAELREELAAAIEDEKLTVRISALRERVAGLRQGGGSHVVDPLGELYQFISRGVISAKDVGFWLPILIAVTIELVAAFGFSVMAAFGHVTRHTPSHPDEARQTPTRQAVSRPSMSGQGTARSNLPARTIEHEEAGSVLDYVTERTHPANQNHAIGAGELHTDYERWCAENNTSALSLQRFVEDFDRLREMPELSGKVRKFGSRYFGIRLIATIARIADGRGR